MPHTDGRYQMAQGFNDGVIMLLPNRAVATGDAATATRNAAGNFSWVVAENKAPVFSFNLGDGLIMRTGYTPDADLQVQNPGSQSVDAYPQGYPPFAGALTNITPRTTPRLKGIKLLSFAVAYKVVAHDLASFTCRVDKTVLANTVAPAITSILASGNNGLSLVANANPRVVEVALAAAEQVYRVSDLSQYWLELAPTSAAAGGDGFELYGVRVKVEFNFN